MMPRPRLSPAADRVLAGLLLAGAGAAFIWGAQRLPALETLALGYDWHNYWVMFQAGRPNYAAADVFNPPWTLALLWPLAALPFKTGWALLTLLTLLVFALAGPRRSSGGPAVPGSLGLLLSFWVLRSIADGNVAALTVAGFLLLNAGWRSASPGRVAAGVLLVTAKPQESALALLVLGAEMVRTWPARRWLAAAGWIGAGALPPLLLWGGDWLGRLLPAGRLSASLARPVNNISLAGLVSAGFPAWAPAALSLIVLALTAAVVARRRWTFTPELTGLLVAAGLLISPYANVTSLAVALAVAVGPLIRSWPLAGWTLLALAFVPYVTAQPHTAAAWPESWQTLYLGLIWAAAAWQLGRGPAAAEPAATEPAR